MNYDL